MTAASPSPVDLDEQRAELKSVLESPQFLRAPKLAQLLSYLCERLFSGQAGQIKEYSIGAEVFGRGEAFDQNSDSIVRVEANRLRKRLAEYYAGDGASHRLHITVPVGQYVPDFEPGPAARAETALSTAMPPLANQSEEPASIQTQAPAPARFRSPGHRLSIWIISTTILVAAALLVAYYTHSAQRQ